MWASILAALLLSAPSVAMISEAQEKHIDDLARIRVARLAAQEKDILLWAEMLFPEKITLPPCKEMHQYFVDIRGDEFTSTEAPRGHAKTTMRCVVIPLFMALEEPDRFRHFLGVQSTDVKTLAVSRAIRLELELNANLRAIYGDMTGERWTDAQFVLKNGVIFTAVSAGQSIRGINYRNERPSWIVVDDLYDTESDANSPELTQKKNDWFFGALYSSRARGKPSSVHIQGTPVNQTDLMEQLKTSPGVKCRSFQAYNEATGAVLWPELNSLASLQSDRERMGSAIFDREMQGKRRNASDAIIKEHWLEGWEYDPVVRWANISRDFGSHSNVRVLGAKLGCDPSTGEQETGDPAGFCVIVETQGPGSRRDWYIEALANESLSFDARLAKLESMSAQHHARLPDPAFRLRRAYIESIGAFQDFGNQAKARTGLPVELVKWVRSKKSNLAAKSAPFEFGKIHVSIAIDKKLRETLKDQLLQNEPPHDDLRDAVLLCLEEQTPNMRSWVLGA